MPLPYPWLQRTFSFDFPPGMHPDLVERLRGTPARLEERVAGLRPDVLTRIPDDGDWSIQDNAGHMLDLESLWSTRIGQILAGEDSLIAWDTTNSATYSAAHNQREMSDILREFRETRERHVALLESIEPDLFAHAALHPRLDQPMRMVDILEFQAQHDDYHLARITQIRSRSA